MNRLLFSFLAFLLACSCGIASANGQGGRAAPQPIYAVWLISQSCRGPASETMTRSPDAERIKADGAVELHKLGVRYQIPHIPKVDEFALKLAFDDKSRGLTDNYVLISDHDLAPPIGALVVTQLPPNIPSAKAVLDVVDGMQRNLAKSSPVPIERRHIADLRLGQGIEYIASNRISSPCFPTSEFRFSPPEKGVKTVGIGRFFVRNGLLIELSYIVSVPDAMTLTEQNTFARAEMDRYLEGLTFTDSSR
ncbi:hypothetical protein [Ottowia thiooxydans]|uniref:hypothetical protein n=1 Tax=Ottowia thiooxydans TaxID=219182 RepID=UPI00048AF3BF|nr:hypothetical protein [Ottowia thiooxydans]